jgi:hypothetical protein
MHWAMRSPLDRPAARWAIFILGGVLPLALVVAIFML